MSYGLPTERPNSVNTLWYLRRVDSEHAELADHGADPRGAAKVIAVGGGRGGVGKSLVAENLAIYLAQLGKSVILVDADPTGANMHAHFGLSAARQDPALDENDTLAVYERALVETQIPGLRLLPAPHD